MRRAPALRADLHHAVVFTRRGEHRLALPHIRADGLLAIHIRARFDRGNRLQRVPMIGCPDEDNVQVFLLEHLAVVAIGARLLP